MTYYDNGKNMRILALDQATKTGWATNASAMITSGVQNFALKRGESPGMRYIRFDAWLGTMRNNLMPDLIVFEDGFRRGGAATEVAFGLRAHIQAFAAKYEIEVTSIQNTVLKKHATGKGNAGKELMVEAAKIKWPWIPIQDDNEADALWLLDYAMKEFGG